MKITKPKGMALTVTLLKQRGAPKKHALVQADVLLEAEMRGRPSHGLQRLSRILSRIERGLVDPRTDGLARWRSEAVPLAAVNRLRERHQRSGVVIATIRNSNHLGMLAYYVEAIASQGLPIELMLAALVDSPLALDIHGTLDAKFPCNKGHLLIAIDASSSRGVGDRLLQYLDQIRSSEPADPETPIRVPGDGAASRASTASRGGFSVDSRLWRELNCLLRPLVPARVGSVQ